MAKPNASDVFDIFAIAFLGSKLLQSSFECNLFLHNFTLLPMRVDGFKEFYKLENIFLPSRDFFSFSPIFSRRFPNFSEISFPGHVRQHNTH